MPESGKRTSLRDYELIVVDCGSRDGTSAIGRQHADHVIELDGPPSQSRARNRGVAVAVGDFQVPFDWAVIFLAYKGWRQLGRYGTGFAHAQTKQLVSVILVPTMMLMSAPAMLSPGWLPRAGGLLVCWLLFNLRFAIFLAKEKGMGFGLLRCAVTFLDHLVMAAGVACGFVCALIKTVVPRPSKRVPCRRLVS